MHPTLFRVLKLCIWGPNNKNNRSLCPISLYRIFYPITFEVLVKNVLHHILIHCSELTSQLLSARDACASFHIYTLSCICSKLPSKSAGASGRATLVNCHCCVPSCGPPYEAELSPFSATPLRAEPSQTWAPQ